MTIQDNQDNPKVKLQEETENQEEH